MPPRSSTPPDFLAMAEKQGEMYADVRTIKHAVNNLSQQMPAIAAAVAAIEQLTRDRDDHERRIAVLEADKHRREGAIGLVQWFSRHWPFTVIIAVATFAWALIMGKIK